MATVPVVPSATAETKIVRRPYFDMKTAERKSKEVTVTLPTRPESLEKALEAAGGDQTVLLGIIHDGLKKHVVKTAKANIELGENEVPSGIVAKFIAGFLPMYLAQGKNKADARKAAIAFVHGSEPIMAMFKAFVTAQIAAGADQDEPGEEEDSDE